MRERSVLLIIWWVLLTGLALASPVSFNFQGRLVDAGDNPLTGLYDITCRLYDASVGGVALWEEAQSVTVANGLFSSALGQFTPLDFAAFNVRQDSLWLEIQVGADPALVPRTQLTPVPLAATAISVRGDFSSSPDGLVFVDSAGDTTVIIESRAKGNVTTTNPPENRGTIRSATHTAFYNTATSDTSILIRAGKLGEGAFGTVYKGKWKGASIVIQTVDSGSSIVLADSVAAQEIIIQTDGIYTQRSGDIGPVRWMAPESIRSRAVDGGTGGIQMTTNSSKTSVDLRGTSFGGKIVLEDDAATAAKSLTFTNDVGDTTVRISDFGLSRLTGNLSVGTDQSLAALTVAGDICATGSIGACSDSRYKRNITPIANALEKVSRIEGVEYEWNREQYHDLSFQAGRQLGVVAQELRQIVPEVVMDSPDGMLAVDYSKLAPLLIEAIKDLKQENDNLRRRVEALEGKSALTIWTPDAEH